LLTGIALLVVVTYFLRGAALGGKIWLQQQSSVAAHSPKPAQSDSASDDSIASASNLKVYGVLAQQDVAASGDDAAPARSGPPAPFEHVNTVDAGAPNHFLHKRLAVKTSQVFAFEVPPHAICPELQGTFRSVATRRNPGGGSVELLLLNEEEFATFTNNKPASTEFSLDPSSRGDIHFELNATFSNPQKYYLVFQNSSKGQGPSIVDTDFTISFE
jgi:hypothetical protein